MGSVMRWHQIRARRKITFTAVLIAVLAVPWASYSVRGRPATVRAGFNEFSPYIIPSEDNQPRGLAIEIVGQAAARANISIQWVFIHGTADDALRRGQIDLFPLLTVTSQRLAEFHVSDPWWENEIALISLDKEKIQTAAETSGKRVAIRGLPILQALAQKLFPHAELVVIPQMERMIESLCTGRVDAFFLDERLVESQLLRGVPACSGHPLYVASIPNGSFSLATVASRGSAAAADKIYAQIARLALDGTLSEVASRWSLYNPYYNRHLSKAIDAEQRATLLRWGLAAMTLIVILVAVQATRIRRAKLVAEAARRKAEESEQRFNAFMQHIPAITCIKDAKGKVIHVNEAFCKETGLTPAQVAGKTVADFLPAEIADRISRRHLEVLERNESCEFRETLRDGSGEEHDFLILNFPFANAAGAKFTGSIWLDITDRKRAQEALRFSQFSIDRSTETVLWVDAEARIFYANEASCRILGYSREELTRMTILQIDTGCSAEMFVKSFAELKEVGAKTIETGYQRRDGSVVAVEVNHNYLEFDGREYTCCIGRDIAERKRAERELAHQALHDSLTGLPNRRLLETQLAQSLKGAHADQCAVAVAYLDLDGFKFVNDTLGHSAGDTLLKQVAARLAGCLREGDTLARVGGDEFTVIMNGLRHAEAARRCAQRLLSALQDPFAIGGHEFWVSASFGIGLYPRDGAEATALLQNSDAAMYEAKRRGKNRIQFYTPAMGHVVKERLEIANQLRRAIEREELSLHFQPRVSLATGAVRWLEAVLRWRNATLGLVSPQKFIPPAEDNGLIVPIGLWALAAACRDAADWIADPAASSVGVSINVSVVQFARPDFVEGVIATLEETGLDPRLLELEVTEAVVSAGIEEVIEKMKRLRAAKVGLSLGDFGAGSSSLHYLQKLPVDTLKIGPSFVRDLAIDPRAVAVAESLVSLAHSLAMRVVIDGVETQEQLEAVRRIGCDLAQGILIGEPRAPSEIFDGVPLAALPESLAGFAWPTVRH